MGSVDLLDPAFLNSILRFATPVLLAAIGGLICQRAGIFNVALEGMLLTGAFVGVAASYATESAAVGVLAAAAGGSLVGALAGVLMVRYRADMIVAGIALNLLASGATVYLLRVFFDVKGTFQDARIAGLNRIEIPIVESIPIVGDIISRQTILVYFALIALAAVYVWLSRTPSGLRLRGVGEDPEAAESLGVDVAAYKFRALVASGSLAGIGGAQLSLGNVTLFVEDMSAGRGWIAVVAVIIANASAAGTGAASILFGVLDSLSLRLQVLNIPSQFTEMLPYISTIGVLAAVGLRRRARERAVLADDAESGETEPDRGAVDR